MRKTLTLIGAGKVGKTLARLWTSHQTFELQDVLTRSAESAQRAVDFIGAGTAVAEYKQLRRANIYLIATPDDQIAKCCEKLARAGCLSADSVVFHCSGAMRSSSLASAIKQGAAVASIHPIRSFVPPEQAAQEFAGTYCGMEGDQRALTILIQAFKTIGAQMVSIDADAKILYHAGAVFAANYLVTLLDIAQQSYVKAGISPEVALKLMEPLVRETVDNVFRLGPEAALTGPIARGDIATAKEQCRAVAVSNKAHGVLYDQLMKLTIELATRRQLSKP